MGEAHDPRRAEAFKLAKMRQELLRDQSAALRLPPRLNLMRSEFASVRSEVYRLRSLQGTTK